MMNSEGLCHVLDRVASCFFFFAGEKRDFRCDCGNQCFRQAGRLGGHLRCTLQGPSETRDQANARNAYNHNFLDK